MNYCRRSGPFFFSFSNKLSRKFRYLTTLDFHCNINLCTRRKLILMSTEEHSIFLGQESECYYAIDPRLNPELQESLTGKNVFVAGAGRGIGQRCATFFAYAAARSLTLISLEIDEVDETAKACQKINPALLTKIARVDVCDAERVKDIMDEVKRDFGGVDVLLVNAGRPPQWLPTGDSDPKIWWETVAVSLQGAFNCSRFALPMMKKKGGSIIFTASAGAHSNYGMASYTIGKLGMIRLCEILHQENFEQHSIKTFAINPGCVRTRFITDFEEFLDKQPKEGSYLRTGVPGEIQSAEMATRTLSGVNFDTPELAAGLVVVLASGKLDFMSGRYIDAKRNIAEYMAEEDEIRTKDLHRVRLHVSDNRFMPSSHF